MLNLSGRSDLKHHAFMISGIAIGLIAWSGHLYTLLAVLALPVLVRYTETRREFWSLIIAYNAAATWTIVPGSHVFFGTSFRPLDSLTLWVAATLVLSAPWGIIRILPASLLPVSISLSLLLGALLPTGIESPLTVAGILFPHIGWLGLVLVVAVFAGATVRPRTVFPAALAVTLCCHVIAPGQPTASADWQGVDTAFGGSGMRDADPFKVYRDAVALQDIISSSSAKTTVFPETVVKRWNAATDLFWQPTYDQLVREGRTIVIGAEQPIGRNGGYRNVLLVRGAQTDTFEQRVPIPIAMWHPYSKGGVAMNMTGPSTILINGVRVAPIICYEQLLTVPVLASMLHRPSIILGVANDYWASSTYIPAIQAASLDAWSRLFWVPVVSAVNR